MLKKDRFLWPAFWFIGSSEMIVYVNYCHMDKYFDLYYSERILSCPCLKFLPEP